MKTSNATLPSPQGDPLDLPLRTLLERVLGSDQGADCWIDIDGAELPVSSRAARAAIRAGELRASRVGKKTLVRRSVLDTWIEQHAIEPVTVKAAPSPGPRSAADLILERNGYARTGGADAK